MTVAAVAVLDYLVNIIPHQNRMSRGDLMGKEAQRRYELKTYNVYTVKLRKVEDAELIARVEALRASGLSATAAFKKLVNDNDK